MEAPEVWKAISTLAQTLLHTDEKILERKDIEKILIETGFLHYLGKFRQGNAPQTARPTQTAQPVRPTQTAQPVQPTQTAKPAQPAAATKGFTREELLKMKESMKNSGNNPKVDKKEGVRKIAEFVKHMKLTEIFIGLTEDPKNIEKISSNIVIEAHSNAVAKEILMYFICLGMEMSPGSSKSKEATCVFVTIK
jgi:hypothetical protein